MKSIQYSHKLRFIAFIAPLLSVTVAGCFGENGGLTFNNNNPIIDHILADGRIATDSPLFIHPGDTVTFDCVAHDPNVDPLTYFWVASMPTPTPTPTSSTGTGTTGTGTTGTGTTGTGTTGTGTTGTGTTGTGTTGTGTTGTGTTASTETRQPGSRQDTPSTTTTTPAATATTAPTATPTPTPGTSTSEIFVWTAPATADITYTITCSVQDDRGGVTAKSVVVVTNQ